MTNNSYPKIYNIFAGDKCIAAEVPEEEFDALWQTVRGMVGLMQTSYSLEDLRYEEWIDRPMTEIGNDIAAHRLKQRVEKQKELERIREEDS